MARLALLFGSFRGGGVGTSFLALAEELLGRGHQVDLVVGKAKGDLAERVPTAARIVPLARAEGWRTSLLITRADPALVPTLLAGLVKAPSGKLRHLPALRRYLARERPDGLIAATAPFNLIAFWARRLADHTCPLVLSEHNRFALPEGGWRYDCPPALARRAYAEAEALTAVSDGIAVEMAAYAGLPRARVTTVYNPVAGPHIARAAAQPVAHPWLQQGQPPVVLGVGMLKPQKDFATLIHAFARLRAERPARLVILGDARGEAKDQAYRDELKALPEQLGIAEDVTFPGFVANPFAWMAKARCFVLSSRWEGLGNVVIEALACGCPVVSTDCPSGPAEILDGGRCGRLVPVGDAGAMAAAIAATLDEPPDKDALIARSELFSRAAAAERYLALLSARARY